ncbi:SBBP repeat-containing protein [Flavobacterium sp. SUN046]|uniref:SBBP repeat-containing protein n=1 Tax=Flavobacterium sp. SUN046 TaxID=3002440 RepID=UPI002DB6CE21|nr:SBBP repeat-containing protein [Flavobacterium sp. SUN046]MEC4050074.1 SBBP repeat-containing protein [Flavobacterium sp. SUN046]
MKTKIYIYILTLLISTLSFSQNLKKIYKEYKQGNIKEAYEGLSKFDANKHKYTSTEINLLLIAEALILSDEKCEEYEPYEELKLFEDNKISEDDEQKIKEFLNQYELNLNSVSKILYSNILKYAKKQNTEIEYKRALNVSLKSDNVNELKELLIETAYKESISNGKTDKLNYFLLEYPNSKYKIEINNLIETNYYTESKNIGTIDSYNSYINKYPKSQNKGEIEKLLYLKAFEIAKTDLTLDSMKKYIKSYPKSDWVPKASELIDSLALDLVKIRNYKSISEYIQSYPNSKYNSELKLKLPDYLYDEIKGNDNIEYCNLFLDNYLKDERSNEVKNRLELAYIKSFNSEYNQTNFNIFKEKFPNSKYIGELNSLLLKEKKYNSLNWDWSKNASGTFNPGDVLRTQGTSIAIDSKGYIYAIGNASGRTIIFNNNSYNLIPNYDGIENGKQGNSCWNTFFIKYDTKGSVLWVKIIKEYNNTKIAIDSKDNIYIACDGHYISKYNPDGEKLWENIISLTEISISVKSSNYIYIAGKENINNLNSEAPSKSGDNLNYREPELNKRIIINKLDTLGNNIWTKELEAINYSSNSGSLRAEITTNSLDNIYIAGRFDSPKLRYGDEFLYLKGSKYKNIGMNSTNGFLIKCDDNGNLIWAKNVGDNNSYNLTYFQNLATDGEGNVYVVGYSDGNVNIASSNLKDSSFLIKYNSNGDEMWTNNVTNCGQINHRISSIAINRFGNVYISGFSWCQNLSFGKYNESAINGNLNYIAKYSSDGDIISTKSIKYLSGTKDKVISECFAIATDKFGNLFVTGNYKGGGLKLGNSILQQPQRDESFFIAKISNTLN